MLRSGIEWLYKLFYLPAFFILHPVPEKPMVIVIASYNNSKWAEKNLKSVFEQAYTNYRVIYIDDASLDGTADLVESIAKDEGQEFRFTLIRNLERKGALANIYQTIHDFCRDEEIVVSMDGDDWLQNSYVLKTLNHTYSKQEIWLTHGTLIGYPKKKLKWSIPIPQKIIENNDFRTYRCPSHLRTFYAWLFKKIDVEDLKIGGEFFPMTWDQAMMFPMIEMAGDRHAFIPETLYVYNIANPINDNKVNAKLQMDLEKIIRSKPRYAKLTEKEFFHAEND